jgi:hypothetical protein
MQALTIVEIEEGSLAVVTGAADDDQPRVLRSARVPLPDLGRETIGNALRALQEDALQGVDAVHVVLGERRMQHFTSQLPRTSPGDAVSYVVREAQRLCGMQSAAEVMVSTRVLRRLPGGRMVLGTTALARSVFEPLQEAFTAAGIAVLGLYSMESLLALAANSSDGRATAVLECNAGRARFVLCDAQSPVQVRRFLIGGAGETNPAALATQFAMELPRTFDWLRETRQPLPSSLLLGTRAGVEDDALSMLQTDELTRVERAVVPFRLAADSLPMPSLGVGMLLARLAASEPVLSLTEAPRLQMPWTGQRLVSLAAALAVGALCSWSALVDGSRLMQTQVVRTELDDELAELSASLAVEGAEPAAAGQLVDDVEAQADRLRTALSTRRPVSRLLAEISNGAGKELHLEELKFTSTERILVVGIVQGRSRQDALASIAAFSERLGKLPYVVLGGEDEINEVARQRNCYRFKLGMTWRNS